MEETKTQTRPWQVRVNLLELGAGLCLVWLGFFMPVFFTVGNFRILETLYQQAKVESVEYGQTIDVKAVCTPRIIGQLGPLVEGWQPHKEPWED